MIRQLFIGALPMLLFVSGISPANACMARNFERWVFLERPPVEVADGLEVLEVEAPKDLSEWKIVEVEVRYRDSPNRRSIVRVNPGPYTSCSRWGITGRRAFVTGVLTYGLDGRQFFAAVQRSPWSPDTGKPK